MDGGVEKVGFTKRQEEESGEKDMSGILCACDDGFVAVQMSQTIDQRRGDSGSIWSPVTSDIVSILLLLTPLAQDVRRASA